MGETSIKSGRKKGFVVLFRSAAQDQRLSLEARGLFALMISLPDDWEYTVSGLAVKAGCGREKVRRLLKELQTVGYLLREQSHDSGGKFGGNVYALQDEAPPLPENPSNGEAEKAPLPRNTVNGENRQREKPSAGFPPQQNKDLIENIDLTDPPYSPPKGTEPTQKKKRRRKSIPSWQPDRFEGFWASYPRDEERAKAVEQWDKLPQDRELMAQNGEDAAVLLNEIARGLKRHLECEEWQDPRYVPHAWRWLRDRRWTEKRKVKSLAAPAALHEPARVVEEEGTYLL